MNNVVLGSLTRRKRTSGGSVDGMVSFCQESFISKNFTNLLVPLRHGEYGPRTKVIASCLIPLIQ